MSNSVGQIGLDLVVNTGGFRKQLSNILGAGKGAAGVFGKLSGIIGGAFAFSKIVGFSAACTELGSDLAEVQNVVDVTFGSMSSAVSDFARNAISSYGLSEKVAKDYMGQFGAMSKAFGYTSEGAYEQAAALTGLSGDVASFYNLSTDEAFSKLKSVYTGETEALKSLGVVMTQSALDSFALAKGYGKTTKAMSEQEKVALRLEFVTDRLSAASGDFIRTSDGWANQTRVLSIRFDALKASIGQGLINALTPVIGVVNDVIASLQLLADAFKNLTAKIFGNASGGSSILGGAADASEQISENIGSAAGSASKMKKILAGFDQLNILSSPSGSAGSGGGSSTAAGDPSSGIGGAGEGSGEGFDTSSLENTLVEITAIVGAASLALGAILTFTGANIPLGIGLMALGAAELVGAVAVDWMAINNSVATTLDVVATTISAASLVLGALLTLTGANMGLGIALLIIGAAGIAAETALNWDAANNECKGAITIIETTVGSALLTLGAVLAFSGANIALGIGLMASGAVSLASAVALNWTNTTNKTKTQITQLASSVGGALLALGAVLAFSGANIPLGIGLMASGAISVASAVALNWDDVSGKTKEKVTYISAFVGAALLGIGAMLALSGVNIPLGLGMIAAGGISLATAIAPNWDNIKSKISSVCTSIKNTFLAMWNAVKPVINGMIGGVEGFVNAIIGGINFIISALNKVSFKIPDWVPVVGGKNFGFNVPEISKVSLPRLASGGYVAANTPQLAIIGDNKHEGEIVAPESKIAEAVAAGFAMVMAKMQQTQTGGGDKPIYLTIKLGDDDFWSGFVNYHNNIVKRTGDSPLLV